MDARLYMRILVSVSSGKLLVFWTFFSHRDSDGATVEPAGAIGTPRANRDFQKPPRMRTLTSQLRAQGRAPGCQHASAARMVLHRHERAALRVTPAPRMLAE